MDIERIILIDTLIKQKASGSPDGLSKKIGISKRAIYKYLKFMKENLGAPIHYVEGLESYVYTSSGTFNFKWNVDIKL